MEHLSKIAKFENMPLLYKADKFTEEFYLTVTFTILISSYGLSVLGLVLTFEIFRATSIPLTTLPKTVCLLSNHG